MLDQTFDRCLFGICAIFAGDRLFHDGIIACGSLFFLFLVLGGTEMHAITIQLGILEFCDIFVYSEMTCTSANYCLAIDHATVCCQFLGHFLCRRLLKCQLSPASYAVKLPSIHGKNTSECFSFSID